MQDRSRYYALDVNGDPYQVDVYVWSSTRPTMEQRKVGADTVDGQDVSTVFLAIDHNHFGGAPLIYETMIFGGQYDQHCWRYSTKQQAQAGHAAVVAALSEGRDPNEAVEQ